MALLTLASELWTVIADATPTPQLQSPPHLFRLDKNFLNLETADWILQPNVGLADMGLIL